MANADAGQYQRFVEAFRFRESGQITLPKVSVNGSFGSEKCYELAVDVIIESIVTRIYRNYKTLPYSGFYGYATLVKRDCLLEKIPLSFGRNRIFQERITEAYQQWQAIAFYLNTERKYLFDILSFITNSGTITIPQMCGSPPFPIAFSEIGLKEIYVKTLALSQFRIELSWVEPRPFTDDCGNEMDGKSQEESDPDGKDGGLPPSGSQPKKNDSDSPYENNEPISVVPPPYNLSSNPDGNLSSNPDGSDNANPDNEEPTPFLTVCSGSIDTYLTAPEPNVGQLASSTAFSNVQLPSDQTFFVDSWEDSTSFTGRFYGIKAVPSGLWFNGATFQTERLAWSQRDTRLTAVCTPL